jgi:hypothetical protein
VNDIVTSSSAGAPKGGTIKERKKQMLHNILYELKGREGKRETPNPSGAG